MCICEEAVTPAQPLASRNGSASMNGLVWVSWISAEWLGLALATLAGTDSRLLPHATLNRADIPQWMDGVGWCVRLPNQHYVF